MFYKPRTVPFALPEDSAQAYDAGIKRGVWRRTQFNEYGTPVVPIQKPLLPGQAKAKLWVCGELEAHRHPIPTPEKLMQKLAGGYGL